MKVKVEREVITLARILRTPFEYGPKVGEVREVEIHENQQKVVFVKGDGREWLFYWDTPNPEVEIIQVEVL